MSEPDYRDAVIQALADAEAALLEDLARVDAERETYRALAQQAIHALHDVTRDRDRLRATHARLLDEYRHLRAQILRETAA